MPLDPSIPMGVRPVQIENPINQLAKVMQVQGLQQEGQMNRLKMDEYSQGVQRTNKLRDLLGAGGGVDELRRGGYLKESMDLDKANRENSKAQAEAEAKQVETAHKRIDSWGQAMGFVRQNPTPENAMAVVHHLVTMGVLPAEMAKSALAGVQDNPQSIAQWATQGFTAALQAKDQLVKTQTNNIGGQTVTQSIDPVTGQARVTSAIQNTQSPDNAANNARIAADAAAGRSVTLRGQDMVDARSRETAELGKVPPGYRRGAEGTLEAIPGGPAALGKALPTKLVSDLGEQAGIADATARFSSTFKPEFAGKTILGEASNVKGRVFGDDTGQAQWWQDYALHESTVRNKLFGASLTPGEQSQWQKLTVTPRMNPEEVKKNLARRTEIEQRGLDRMMSGAAAGGYNKEQIEAVTGRPVPPKSAGVTPAQPSPSGFPADIDAILKKHGGKK